jgi:ribonuclease P protein component
MGIVSSFTRQEIRALFSRARPVVVTPFLEIRKAPSLTSPRVLFVIPRRVGNAVKRNKLRRRLKELFYANRAAMEGYDFLVLAKNTHAATLSYEELGKLVQRALS